MSDETPGEVIAGWFTSSAFSHCVTREDAARQLIELLGEHGYSVIKKPKRGLTLGERNAGIRAYNSQARDTLSRGQMVDAIAAAINDESLA